MQNPVFMRVHFYVCMYIAVNYASQIEKCSKSILTDSQCNLQAKRIIHLSSNHSVHCVFMSWQIKYVEASPCLTICLSLLCAEEIKYIINDLSTTY